MKNRKPNEAKISKKIIVYLILTLGVIISLFPFYLMFTAATQVSGDILRMPPKLNLGHNLINNFDKLESDIGIGKVLFNSLFISLTYTIVTIFLCSLAGYAFAKFEFKGKKILFGIVLVTIMIPSQVLLVPLFNMMHKLNMINTYQAVILPTLANAFGIFLMRQNMISFPTSLIEAARIDGCGEISIFFNIVMPNVSPALGALGIYMFMAQWDNFMWPLIALTTPDMYTLPLALSSLNGAARVDFGEIMLCVSIATIPIMILFLIFQKQFVEGLLGGSVKG